MWRASALAHVAFDKAHPLIKSSSYCCTATPCDVGHCTGRDRAVCVQVRKRCIDMG